MTKKLIILAIASLLSTSAFGQVKGLTAGIGIQSYSQTSSLTVANRTISDITPFSGFYVGADYKVYSFGPGINVTPGIYFSTASYKNKDFSDIQMKESYLGIPINFSYTLDLVPGTLAIAPYVGPTISLGLSKKSTADNWANTTDCYSKDYDYSRFNIAIGGGIAIDIVEMVRVSFGYNLYLLNNYKGDEKVKYLRGGAFHIGAAYIF